MRFIDLLKSPLAALKRLRTAPAKDAGPGPYRIIPLRVPAEMEPTLKFVMEQQLASANARGLPIQQISEEACILSCIQGMSASHLIVAERGRDPDGKAH